MKTPLIIAHRGASAVAPENTLTAFRNAIDARADGVELDIRMAAEGVPVVIHDATLQRTAGLAGRVNKMTSSQLSQTDVGSWFNRRYPERAEDSYTGETVPTLEKALGCLGDIDGLVYLEIKTGSTSEVAPLTDAAAEIISNSALMPNIIVQCFDLAVISRMRIRLPKVKTAALFGPRLRHFVRGRQRIVDLALEHGAGHLSLHKTLVNKETVELANVAGLPVTVWTVDDPRAFERYSELGVFAAITNDPKRIRDRR